MEPEGDGNEVEARRADGRGQGRKPEGLGTRT
jgi:hypothetical protein